MRKKAFYSSQELDCFMLANEHEGPQLPQGNMRMLDRVMALTENEGPYHRGTLVAEYDIDPEQWFFSCHFPGDPVMPGCLALDGLWQCLGFYLAWRGHQGKARAIGVDGVRFLGEVLPDSRTIQYRLNIRRIMNRDFTLGISDGEVWVDNKAVYRAENLRVALFRVNQAQALQHCRVECA